MKGSTIHLVALADIHGITIHLPTIEGSLRQADAVVIAGDVTNFGGGEAAAPIIEAIEAINPHIAAVYGNCDRPEVQAYLADHGLSVHSQIKQICGLTYIGIGGSLVCSGRTPSEVDDAVLAAGLDLSGQDLQWPRDAGPQPVVLVTHQPAYGTRLDEVGGSSHTGSRAIRAFIERFRPILAVSGHLHEAIGVDTIGPTTLVNPGPFKLGRYALIEVYNGKVQVELIAV